MIKKIKFPLRLAIIDLGTNSVRYDIYDVKSSMEVLRLHREKVMIRLGDGLYEKGRLDHEAMLRAENAFIEIQEQIKKFKVARVAAYATSALRDSEDKIKFISRIKRKTEIAIRVLPGEDEARLIAKGIMNNLEVPAGAYALIDIGGGSTEISICHKKSILDSCSFNLGASRLQQLYLKTSPPQALKKKNPVDELRKHIWDIVTDVIQERQWPPTPLVIGSSGTIRAFKRIMEKKYDLHEPFDRKNLTRLVKELEKMGTTKILAVPGMDPKRADIILAGGVLLDELMEILSAEKLTTSKYALRDGMLDEELENIFFPGMKNSFLKN